MLPDDVTSRIEALQDPAGFVDQIRAELGRWEVRDARRAAWQAQRRAWEQLDPDVARRYKEAIAQPWTLLVPPRDPPDPRQAAARARVRKELAWLQSDAPDAVATRDQAQRAGQQRLEQARQARAEQDAAVRARIIAAGLPYRPDLLLPPG